MLHADRVARLVHEAPHALEVALAAERCARLALLGDDPVEHELGGDAGVVDPGQPERVVAAHAVVADQDVLDGHEQRVADVERAGDVRRRLGDDEALRARRLGGGREGAGGQPAVVDGGLDRAGVVAGAQLAALGGHRSVLHLLRSSTKPARRRTNGLVVVPPSFATDAVASSPRYRADPDRLACDLRPPVLRRASSLMARFSRPAVARYSSRSVPWRESSRGSPTR